MKNEARAVVLEKFNEPLVLRNFPIPNPKDGEVLVRVETAGVCGSDVHMWEGRAPRIRLPMILGHEGAGEIVEMNREKNDVHGTRKPTKNSGQSPLELLKSLPLEEQTID